MGWILRWGSLQLCQSLVNLAIFLSRRRVPDLVSTLAISRPLVSLVLRGKSPYDDHTGPVSIRSDPMATNRTITIMRMRNVTILKFRGRWAVQMDFLFENCTF